ncbi:MAG: prepilin-type N-terminal cleavage/methylation domain-containing protein [Thermodesulfobacteriota bacterium]|nr:prepilin-type N-terminal cleavage/methylation domain-containing protein [Thermodesulfobacteriota bacterium]
MRNESGFTLIEIIVSLVLVGMMAAIAGMGIVTGTKGYLLAKENSHMAQKAQIAMARIQRELMELTDIAATQADPAFIVYDNTTGRHAIAREGSDVKMYDLPAGVMSPPADAGDILVDNVNNFTLSYYQGTDSWNGADIQRLSTIKADLTLDRSDGAGDTVTFTTTVNPRNTNNYGGVPPTAAPFSAPNYTCFVAAVASGETSVPTALLFGLFIVAFAFLSLFFLTQRHHASPSAMHGKQRRTAKGHVLRSRRRSRKRAQRLGGGQIGKLEENKGNVLIGLIVTMMIFAALGAGMVAMTGTSTFSQVTANTTSKAYYLAESGFRYAASVYVNTGDTDTDGEIEDDRNQQLQNIDGSVFTLINPDKRFDLVIFPYYFVTTGPFPSTSTLIGTMFPGQMPDNFTMPATGRINIGNHIYNYTGYAAGIFTILGGLTDDVGARMNVLPVGNPPGAATMTNGGDLTLVNAAFFPAITGKFMINGITYTYATRNGNTFQNITDANNPARVFSLPVDANTNLILRPYLRVRSTGTVGQGVEAASRDIIYNVPIPDSPTEGITVQVHDTFETTDHWKGSTWGSHAVQNIEGENVLKVTGTGAVPGAPKASLIGLDWSTTDANLASAHSLSGYFLSYDAQVKVGFVPPFTPGSWSDGDPETNGPDGLPKYYAAGLSFRLDESNNSYGVSFMRGSNFTNPLPDNIDDAIVPQDQVPLIVLWQQINSGADRQWLAYKYLTGPIIFFDDMDSGAPGWSAPIDNATPPWWLSSLDSHSLPTMWSDRTGHYVNNEDASLISPSIDLTGHTSAVLTFWHEYFFNDAGDSGRVYINGSEIASFVGPDSTSDWVKVAIDISEYIPNNVQITFRIQTDGAGTDHGWHIDDVAISEGFSVNESTLLVRIKEAGEVRFNSGGTTAIEDGDIITQANGAMGTVVGNPILSAGSWAGGDAVGIITLNRVSGTFNSGQAILVGGSNLATCQGFTDRNNYIKVFYGDVTGEGTANNDPFDLERSPNLRNEIHWPPGEVEDWSAETDFFTLVRWDAVNTTSLPTVDIVPSAYETGVIILSDENTLFTPDSGILSYARPELGLHTFGHGSTDVYFDDFGLQVEIASGAGFLTPIQE